MKLDFPYYDVKTVLIPGFIVCSCTCNMSATLSELCSPSEMSFGLGVLFLVASYIVGEIVQLFSKFFEEKIIFRNRTPLFWIIDDYGCPTNRVCTIDAAKYYLAQIKEMCGCECFGSYLRKYIYQICISVKRDDKQASELLKTRANTKLFRALSFAWLFVIAALSESDFSCCEKMSSIVLSCFVWVGICWRYYRFLVNYAAKLYAYHYSNIEQEIIRFKMVEITPHGDDSDSMYISGGVIGGAASRIRRPITPATTNKKAAKQNAKESRINEPKRGDKAKGENQSADAKPGEPEQPAGEEQEAEKENAQTADDEAPAEKKGELNNMAADDLPGDAVDGTSEDD